MLPPTFITPTPIVSHPTRRDATTRRRQARPRRHGPAVRVPQPHSRNPIFAPVMTSSPSPTSDPSDNVPPRTQSDAADVAVSTAVSSAPTLNSALAEAASRSLANLPPGGPPTVAVIFVSGRYSVSNVGQTGRHSTDLVVPRLRALIPELTAVVGCTTDGVIGAAPTGDIVELENAPALSLTLMRLPRITVTPFHVMPDDLPSLDAPPAAWDAVVGRSRVPKGTPAAFMVFSDPSFAERGGLSRFLSGIEYAFPGSTVVGALASAAAASSKGHMFCTLPRDVLSPEATSLRDSGLVGIALSGDVQLDCLVSSGCRAIGPEFEVRKVGPENTILEMELVGRPSSCLPATGQLKSLVSYATAVERNLLQDCLHIGVKVDQLTAGTEDFAIRHVIGVDLYAGGITVAQTMRVGQRVRFYVMERETAAEELDQTMQKYKRVELANSLVGYSNPPFGAMVFVDAGRGRALMRERDMETTPFTSVASGVPVAGCFSGGQIGPCRSGADGVKAPSIVHMAANLVALVRRRSGMSPSEPIDSPSNSTADVEDGVE